MSGIHAARVAARIRKELGIEVDEVAGHYGEFAVIVDDAVALKAGSLGFLGVLPAGSQVVTEVKRRIAR